MSEHKIPVIKIDQIEEHPNADRLEIIAYLGYTCVVRKGDFKVGDLAVYIPPDYNVPLVGFGAFAFLRDTKRPNKEFKRITASRLRGVVSYGLLIPCPLDEVAFDDSMLSHGYLFEEGDCAMEHYGITRYEAKAPYKPGVSMGSQDQTDPPDCQFIKYNVESFKNHHKIFQEGEQVVATEKIHGANARFVFQDGEMHCGSRQQWKKRDENNRWWQALEQNEGIRSFCERNEGKVLYGEIYGPMVQSFSYGLTVGQVGFAAFDILNAGNWMDYYAFCGYTELHDIPTPPVYYEGPFDAARLVALCELPSVLTYQNLGASSDHITEGLVIRPMVERWERSCGRVNLKMISDAYLGVK